jgi:hypothetical protein
MGDGDISLVNKLFLWKKLFNLTMGYGDFVANHMDAFSTIVT